MWDMFKREWANILLNLNTRSKGKLAGGIPIGSIGRLSDVRIKKLQKDCGLAIRQNTMKKSNPGRREVEVAVYAMKKKHCNSPSQC